MKPVAIAFASIVLPVPGAPRKSRPRSRLPPALERLARLPERDDAVHLFLRLDLAADVGELDAPLCVARLEARICEMPMISIGPMKIAKFAMKRKKTKTT